MARVAVAQPAPALAPPMPAPISQPVVPLAPTVEAQPTFDANETVHASDIARLLHAPTTYGLTFSTGERVLVSTRRVLVGRDPQPLDNPDVELVAVADPQRRTSRTHLSFHVHAGRLFAEDLESANGSAVIAPDGSPTPLPAGTAVDVSNASTIWFGGCAVAIVAR